MLKRLINKIFKRQITEEVSSVLATLSDILPLPTRTEFLCDSNKLELIDKYKEEYFKYLRSTRTIVSRDIMPEHLHNFKNIYTDLLSNLCIEDNSDISFEPINVKEQLDERLDMEIKCLKLKLYQESVEQFIIEVKLRLVALTELLEEKNFTKNRRNVILNEINNLHSSLIIFTNQKVAMLKETSAYLTDITNFDIKSLIENVYYEVYLNKEMPLDSSEQELVNKRLEEVREMAKLVIPDILASLEAHNLHPKLLIASLEQELEIYVYTHKEVLKSLNKETENLYYEVNKKTGLSFDFSASHQMKIKNNEEILRENKSDYIKRIRNLELQYKIFSKYGRNLVTKKYLEKLYEVKFKILTLDIFEDDNFDILSNATFTELECFSEIVLKKIECILKCQNPQVEALAKFNKKPISEIVKVIKDIVKSDEEFSFYDILNSQLLLAILLSFDNVYGLQRLQNLKVSKSEFPDVNFYDDLFKWEDKLPLDTIFRVIRANRNITPVDDWKEPHPLYSLYLLSPKYEDKYEYRMPEGLTEINIPTTTENDKNSILLYLRSLANKKRVVMPSTLTKISGNLFEKCSIGSITLNEGLKVLGEYSLLIPDLKEVIFPSTLVKIADNAVVFSQLETIGVIVNHTQKPFLAIEDYFVEYCFKALKTKKVSYYHVPEHIKEKQRLYREGRYSSFCDSDLFAHDDTFITYNISPTFKKLILYSETGEYIAAIDNKDITIEAKRSEYHLKHYINRNYCKLKNGELLHSEKSLVKNKLKTIMNLNLGLEENSEMGTRIRKPN